MIASNVAFLENELMDVVRLFEGADALAFVHEMKYDGETFYNRISLGERAWEFSRPARAETELVYKSLAKRYAKLALYLVLSEYFGKTLPWGALTGIRPTRLAYAELEHGRPFEPLFRDMGVSEDNIRLTARIIEGQRGIIASVPDTKRIPPLKKNAETTGI